jgi:hypothetical protein
MKKSINPQAIEIQKRFFQALDYAISSDLVNGVKGFCDNHNLNRVKYTRIKNNINKTFDEQMEERTYKIIDVDALAYICNDFGISPEWLLFGRGKMLVK